MDKAQIELVRSTWARLLPIRADVAELFYSKLFELEPQLRPLFRRDLGEQRKRMIAMLDIAVRGLDHPQALAPAFRDLGGRHVRYGVSPADYGIFVVVLLWTLEQSLGAAFTADMRRAWTEAYAVITSIMRPGG
ncbi:MAG: globin family protein [Sinimarinibacterium sp.]|jgi:hemoglobin-like flavoprotein